MKKIKLVLALTTLSLAVFGQKIKDEKISFDYTRLPYINVGNSVTTYNGSIELTYLSRIEGAQAMYEQELAAAEDEFNSNMAAWESAKQQIDADFDAAMAAYNSKSAGAKILESAILNESKPVKAPYPVMPRKRIVPQPVLPKVYDPNVLGSSFVKIDGFTMGTDANALQVVVKLNGFEVGEVRDEQKTTKRTDKSGRVYDEITYFKVVTYKHPMSVRVVSPEKGMLVDEFLEACNGYRTFRTQPYKSQYDLNRYYEINEPSILAKLDDEITMDNLAVVRDYLNDNFGYSLVKRETILNDVEHKKVPYTDYNEAYIEAFSGYNMLASESTVEEGKAKIQKAVALWEKALEESDLEDKKARINEKVTGITRLNLAEAYTWLNDYTKAEEQINRIKLIGKNKFEKYADDYIAFIRDQRARFEASTK
jgi:hypothetical protein